MEQGVAAAQAGPVKSRNAAPRRIKAMKARWLAANAALLAGAAGTA